MKRFELFGIIKEGNKRVAYFIIDTEKTSLECGIMNANAVIDLASNGLVRKLKVSNNQLICVYDDIEISNALSNGFRNISQLEHNYFINLPSFKSKHVVKAHSGVGICLSCVDAMLTTNDLEFKYWGRKSVVNFIESNNSRFYDIFRYDCGDWSFGSISFPVDNLDMFKSMMKANNILCDFSCIKRKLPDYKSNLIDNVVNDLQNIVFSIERKLEIH